MGLANAALSFLAREHLKQSFCGPVLTLGRQDIAATRMEAYEILRRAGLAIPVPLPEIKQAATPMTDREFFQWLGLKDVQALDYSDYEHAEIIADLNQPIPETLRNKFSLIIDGGTLEHVFHVRQALVNCVDMLKPGGRIIHISPANNWTNHGFYQFSPTLYLDYYQANNFTKLQSFLAEQPLLGFEFSTWECFKGPFRAPRLTSSDGLMNFFVAEKTLDSTSDKIPVQSFYQRIYNNRKATASRFQALRTRIPYRWQARIARRLPWLNPYRKPWGQTRSEKLG